MDTQSMFVPGGSPCAVPHQSIAPAFRPISWNTPRRSYASEPSAILCGNVPPWFCSCTSDRCCPTVKPPPGYTCTPTRCGSGDDVGPTAPFRWTIPPVGAPSPVFPPRDEAVVKAIACEIVHATKVPLSRQSLADVTARASSALGQPISRSTVWRILDADAIKPWQYTYWIFPRDPQFAEKAGVVLDLYAGLWQGTALGNNDYILSADEKTSIQARIRCHPSLSPVPGRERRVEHEYARGGAL